MLKIRPRSHSWQLQPQLSCHADEFPTSSVNNRTAMASLRDFRFPTTAKKKDSDCDKSGDVKDNSYEYFDKLLNHRTHSPVPESEDLFQDSQENEEKGEEDDEEPFSQDMLAEPGCSYWQDDQAGEAKEEVPEDDSASAEVNRVTGCRRVRDGTLTQEQAIPGELVVLVQLQPGKPVVWKLASKKRLLLGFRPNTYHHTKKTQLTFSERTRPYQVLVVVESPDGTKDAEVMPHTFVFGRCSDCKWPCLSERCFYNFYLPSFHVDRCVVSTFQGLDRGPKKVFGDLLARGMDALAAYKETVHSFDEPYLWS